MGTFNSFLWGGTGGGTPSTTVGVTLASIVQRAYRIAGITKWVGTTPQDDWFAEAIAEMNAMIGGLNCSRMNIFTITTRSFPISGGTKIFNIGPGAVPTTVGGVNYGAFDMPRPQQITAGVIILANSSPPVRMPPMYPMNDAEWSYITLQDIPNGIPLAFYYDGSFDRSTGWSKVYLWPQTSYAYAVEWYFWEAIPTFAAKTDQVALPPGYEDLLVYCLAERLYNLNPLQSKMTAEAHRQARMSLATIQSYNAPEPKPYWNDAADVGKSRGSGHFDYRIGTTRGGWGW